MNRLLSTSAWKWINSSAPFVLSLQGYHLCFSWILFTSFLSFLFTCLEHGKIQTLKLPALQTAAISRWGQKVDRGASDKFARYVPSQQSVKRAQTKLPGWGQLMFMAQIQSWSTKPCPQQLLTHNLEEQAPRDVWGMQKGKQSSHALKNVRSTIKTMPQITFSFKWARGLASLWKLHGAKFVFPISLENTLQKGS